MRDGIERCAGRQVAGRESQRGDAGIGLRERAIGQALGRGEQEIVRIARVGADDDFLAFEAGVVVEVGEDRRSIDVFHDDAEQLLGFG